MDFYCPRCRVLLTGSCCFSCGWNTTLTDSTGDKEEMVFKGETKAYNGNLPVSFFQPQRKIIQPQWKEKATENIKEKIRKGYIKKEKYNRLLAKYKRNMQAKDEIIRELRKEINSIHKTKTIEFNIPEGLYKDEEFDLDDEELYEDEKLEEEEKDQIIKDLKQKYEELKEATTCKFSIPQGVINRLFEKDDEIEAEVTRRLNCWLENDEEEEE